jgi:hypothetical protein
MKHSLECQSVIRMDHGLFMCAVKTADHHKRELLAPKNSMLTMSQCFEFEGRLLTNMTIAKFVL